MGVAAGMAVMAVMFNAEIATVCGPKGQHNRRRAAVRHGTGKGSVTLGGRRVPVDRPQARAVDGHRWATPSATGPMSRSRSLASPRPTVPGCGLTPATSPSG